MAAAVPPNDDIVRGFKPVGTISGADYRGYMRRVMFPASDSTATFIGDLVKLQPNGDTDGTTPAVAQAAQGDYGVGVLVSLEPDTTDEGSLSSANYRLASTLRYGQVCYGSDVLYSIQEDSDSSALAATDCGTNCDIIVAAGDTNTGLSGMELDSSTVNTTNSLAIRLHHVTPRVGNKVGDNAEWTVSLNLSDDRNTTGVS
jgi:hypothetical protein